jgi:hypothetical protein
MALETIYGFISDRALHFNTKVYGEEIPDFDEFNNPINYTPVPGIIDTNILSYFVNKGVLSCESDNRFTNTEYNTGVGNINIYFDSKKTPNFNTIISADNEYVQFSQSFFNIIEYVLRANITSTTILQNIESELFNNTNGYFNGYVAGSLITDFEPFIMDYNTVQSGFEPDTPIQKYISFDMTLNANDYKFVLYIDHNKFMEDYPHSTIIKVIPPCSPSQILSMNFPSNRHSIIASGDYFNNILTNSEFNIDYTGVTNFKTNYVNNEVVTYNFPFTLLYKGKLPSTEYKREAIKEFLNNTTEVENPEDIWPEVFPGLYIDKSFMIIPLWDNITELVDMKIDHGMVNYNDIITKVTNVISELDETFIKTYSTILIPPSGYLYMLAFPSAFEQTEKLKEEHPTYQPCDPLGPTWDYQTSITKDFNEKLSDCIAQLKGTANLEYFRHDVIYGKNFLTFQVGTSEYSVLFEQDFLNIYPRS